MRILVFSLLFTLISYVALPNAFFASQTKSQYKVLKSETVVIKTPTIQCGMCKNRIEKNVGLKKGIKAISVDVEKKEVVYNPKKITVEEIRQAISAVGYDADDEKANAEAYEKLPACCQIGGH